MSNQWTSAQRDAFTTRCGDMLVCAAAGSGKTTVLTERVIRSLTDESEPVDITRMLIVTFTKASAADLKKKLSDAITKKMGEGQGNTRLHRQLLALDRAQISTIDSFCMKILSDNFTSLSLPASPSIGDDAEISLLKNQVMEQLIDELYQEKNHEFYDVVQNFTVLRDNELAPMLIKIYDTVISYPEGIGFVADAADKLHEVVERGIFDTDYGRELAASVIRPIEHYFHAMSAAFDRLDADEKNYTVFETELETLGGLLAYGDASTALYGLSGFEFEARLKPNKDKSVDYDRTVGYRSELKKAVEAAKKLRIGHDGSEHRAAAERSEQICRKIYGILQSFEARYCAEKQRLGILDFADLERYAYKLLVGENGATEVAKKIAQKYDQIYIDEYQDSNRLQDEIFKAISRENRFMVGDIKQSIYSFRGAVPDLFAGYRMAFPDYIAEREQSAQKIFLSHNFRSNKPVLDFANAVFDKLFPLGNIPYSSEEDALRFPDIKDASEGTVTDVTVIGGEATESFDPEAAYVAYEIKKQIDAGRKASDFAILLRSMGNSAKQYERELALRGIACENSADDNFFECPEILLMLALLGAVDNPRRDVYLAGAIKSPVFGVSLDELILIRKKYPARCLYESIVLAASDGDFPKVVAFLEFLDKCRNFASKNTVDRLIRMIYRLTSIRALAGSASDSREAGVDRLRRLYAFAHSFEKSGFRGLHRFMSYLRDAEDGKKSPTVAKPSGNKDCVHILSIHKSKGLEYKYVYLCNTARKLNSEDLSRSLLLEKDMGIAFKLRDANGYTVYDPLVRRSIGNRMRENLVNEELRVLYVALTRARDELHVTGFCNEPDKKLALLSSDEPLDFYRLSKVGSYLDWILLALSDADGNVRKIGTVTLDESIRETVTEVGADAIESTDEAYSVCAEELDRRINYVYPYAAETMLPSKAVVSRLHPTYLDDEPEVKNTFHSRPAFMDTAAKEPTGAQRGTAAHLFMQFCDFDYVCKYGANAELTRLLDRGYIDKASAMMIDTSIFTDFFSSSLFAQMSSSSELHREYRFLLARSADSFTENAELAEQIKDAKLLVQGVIDCFFLLPDGTYKLVDYKTDRVKNSSDPEKAVKTLRDEYRDQLSYYRDAIEQLSGKKVSKISIYAFELHEEIEIE